MDQYDFRIAMFEFLNKVVLGFMEGTKDGMRDGTVRRAKEVLDVDLDPDSVTVIFEWIENPKRRLISIHVEHEGEHYESILRNGLYNEGYEDW